MKRRFIHSADKGRNHIKGQSSKKHAERVVVTAVCCVFVSSSLVCHSSCLSHFTPGPHLQSCSPGLRLQSTPLHKPFDSLLSVPDRTTHYSGNDPCLVPVILVNSRSLSRLLLFFDHNPALFSSASSYPDPSLQLACLALPPATSSTTCSHVSFNKPFFYNSTSSPSALGFSIVYLNRMMLC